MRLTGMNVLYIHIFNCVCTRQRINQILSDKSTEIPYVYIFMKHCVLIIVCEFNSWSIK